MDKQNDITPYLKYIYLHIFCTYEPNRWNKVLPIVQFAHNSRTHEELKQSPFYLMYGSTPVALPQIIEQSATPVADEHIRLLIKAREEALAVHNLARLKMAQRTMKYSKPFKEGEKVWLDSKNLPKSRKF
jgi:hypothetical protein